MQRAEGPPPDVLPLSPAYVCGTASRPAPPTSVEFEGTEYPVDDGIKILMGVVRDKEAGTERRIGAIQTLSRFAPQLRDEAYIDDLKALYRRTQELPLKAEILRCVGRSGDARGLELFHAVLDEETSPFVRLLAAGELADWNVRLGVKELIKLLEPDNTTQPGKRPPRTLSDEAAICLQGLNRRKGWGFPEEEVREAMKALGKDNLEESERLFRDRWKAWFEANKDRFPTWPPKTREHDEPAQNGGHQQRNP
ncbi:MAG: hypothetical protein JSV19_09470 [Phycisphaerales bacterium]|nr:MAG: hypothetical protein JSV19_09470 [Phycisphaerales bacterium]